MAKRNLTRVYSDADPFDNDIEVRAKRIWMKPRDYPIRMIYRYICNTGCDPKEIKWGRITVDDFFEMANDYPADATTIRLKARNIANGTADSNGYAGHLRSCTGRIEVLEMAIDIFMHGNDKNMVVEPDVIVTCDYFRVGIVNDDMIDGLRGKFIRTRPGDEGPSP